MSKPDRCTRCGRSHPDAEAGIGGLYPSSTACYTFGPDGYPEPAGDHEFPAPPASAVPAPSTFADALGLHFVLLRWFGSPSSVATTETFRLLGASE